MKSFIFSCFISALNLYFAQKLRKKGQNCSRLQEPQKVTPNAKSCAKVVEHNQDRLRGRGVLFNNMSGCLEIVNGKVP